jgi:hypothetical protein
MEVDVHQSDFVSFFGKAKGQVDSHGRFADATLAAHDQDFVFDTPQGSGDGDILLGQPGIARITTALLIGPAGTSTRTAHICLQRWKNRKEGRTLEMLDGLVKAQKTENTSEKKAHDEAGNAVFAVN